MLLDILRWVVTLAVALVDEAAKRNIVPWPQLKPLYDSLMGTKDEMAKVRKYRADVKSGRVSNPNDLFERRD